MASVRSSASPHIAMLDGSRAVLHQSSNGSAPAGDTMKATRSIARAGASLFLRLWATRMAGGLDLCQHGSAFALWARSTAAPAAPVPATTSSCAAEPGELAEGSADTTPIEAIKSVRSSAFIAAVSRPMLSAAVAGAAAPARLCCNFLNTVDGDRIPAVPVRGILLTLHLDSRETNTGPLFDQPKTCTVTEMVKKGLEWA